MDNKHIQRGSICWLHFFNQGKPGHSHCGDYAYIRKYAPNHSKKIEDDELYVKVVIKDIFWIYNKTRFIFEIMNSDGSLCYQTSVDEPERLTCIGWNWPKHFKWSGIE